MGLFRLGEMENDKPICRYFKKLPTLAFSGNEVMINEAFRQMGIELNEE